MDTKLPSTFIEIMGLLEAVCTDRGLTLSDELGVRKHQPRDWTIRDSIPSERWKSVCEFSQRNGLPFVTTALLTEIAARKLEKKADAHAA